jgi:hypothetical protein
MELRNTIEEMRNLLIQITDDLEKADGGNKAASQRVRTGTVKLEKVAKHYRKESIQEEKHTKGDKKPSKKPAAKAAKSKAPVAKAAAAKAPAKAQKATVKPRAFAVKKSTAKLPARRG